MTKLSSMKSALRRFERRVIFGAAGLAGVGATAMVARWQQDLGALAETRDAFIAETGEDAVVSSAYQQVASSLDALSATISGGHKDAIMEAGIGFYASLLQAHDVFAQFVPAEVRGVEKPPEETIARIGSVLNGALGL